jgi:uncharacterized membrane protein YhhN
MDMLTACAVLTGAFVAAVVVGEFYRKKDCTPLLVWVFKPLASAGFLAAALVVGALGHGFGRWMFAALFLCFAGDILLIPRTRKAFLFGLLCFLCAHVAFIAAFLHKSLEPAWIGSGAGVMLVISVCTGVWLWPHVGSKMKAPLVGYIIAIAIMVSLASGVWAGTSNHTLMAAAALFAFSDIIIARDRFVRAEFINRAMALPLYYLSQFLFALSAGI